MGTRLYVGNLPYNMGDDELREVFSRAGSVESATVIKDRESGQSRGFGFVEMSSAAEAEAAIQALDGFTSNNRQLRVSLAREREAGRSFR
jgi:RNA recognition motif-containing protein